MNNEKLINHTWIRFFTDRFERFENWFNANFGWFFTNGNKINRFDASYWHSKDNQWD